MAPAIPPTQTLLPESCILVSFDVEAIANDEKKTVFPGSCASLGAAAFLWPEGTLVPQPVCYAMFYRNIATSVSVNNYAMAFWQKHPDAYYALSRDHQPAHLVREAFDNWVAELGQNYNRPTQLISGPHAFDGTHLSLLGPPPAKLSGAAPVFHDVVETLAAIKGITTQRAKKLFKDHLLPAPHIADLDAYLQGLAFCAAAGA